MMRFDWVPRAYTGTTDFINDHFKALNKHDVAAIAHQYSPDAQIFSPDWDVAKIGPAEIIKAYTSYFAALPNISYEVTNVTKSDNTFIVDYTCTINKTDNGLSKNVKHALICKAAFVIYNNRIIKETNSFNHVAFLKHIGFSD